MSERATWETDFRWRRVRVSSELLDAFFRGQMDATSGTTAPPDLLVVGLYQLASRGVWEFIVWSATFDPVPNDGTRALDTPFPLVDFEYRR